MSFVYPLSCFLCVNGGLQLSSVLLIFNMVEGFELPLVVFGVFLFQLYLLVHIQFMCVLITGVDGDLPMVQLTRSIVLVL